MFKNAMIMLVLFHLGLQALHAKSIEYGSILCKKQGFHCVEVGSNDSWSSLFPDAHERDLIKRLNRTNEFLETGMLIAVPDKVSSAQQRTYSPLPLSIAGVSEKVVIIDPDTLVFGAYNAQGTLLKWGPISAGTRHCFESKQGCMTPSGTFRIQRKKGRYCFSNSLPEVVSGTHGGAYMPYCMYFHKGYSLHGSDSLPGYHQSHGCVRLLTDDARWLNESFVDLPDKNRGQLGTKIVIKPYNPESGPLD